MSWNEKFFFQLSMCLVAQVSSITSHRVAINSGFQINYALPFQLKDFYSPIYWARSFSNVSSPVMNFFERLARIEEDEEDSNEVTGDSDDESDEEVQKTNDEMHDTSTDDVDSENEEIDDVTTTEISTTTTRKVHRKRKPKIKRELPTELVSKSPDLTAGQFYAGLQETMS